MSATIPALRVFARRLLRLAGKDSPDRFLESLVAREPVLARLIRDGLLRAYLASARKTARPALRGSAPPPVPPRLPPPFAGTPDDHPDRLPGVEAAARWLADRRLLTPDQFEALDDGARRAAFTVARTATLDAVRKVRDAVAESVRGGTLADFRADVKDALDESMLSPARTEALFRTHVGQATAAGQRAILDHPLVGDEFPYLLLTAVHDSRTRPDHLEMERWGQNGTAVYRRDDPIWDTLWPPMGWNCRCHVIPLTIEDAAAHGSREAMRWLKTGIEPVEKDWARRPYPVIPPEGWPDQRGVAAVV
jgi:SPP1 gp7 family putative phage head morphogenesis protein